MLDFKDIINSYITAMNPSPEEKEIAKHRMDKCNECPNKRYEKIIGCYVCDLCGCPLKGKIFTSKGPQSCPDKPSRWEK